MNPSTAQNAIAFLNRCPLKGDEVPAFVAVMKELELEAHPEIKVLDKTEEEPEPDR